jgi:hypothetical protein
MRFEVRQATDSPAHFSTSLAPTTAHRRPARDRIAGIPAEGRDEHPPVPISRGESPGRCSARRQASRRERPPSGRPRRSASSGAQSERRKERATASGRPKGGASRGHCALSEQSSGLLLGRLPGRYGLLTGAQQLLRWLIRQARAGAYAVVRRVALHPGVVPLLAPDHPLRHALGSPQHHHHAPHPHRVTSSPRSFHRHNCSSIPPFVAWPATRCSTAPPRPMSARR